MVVGGALLLGILFLAMVFVKAFLRICPPNEVLVITGGGRRGFSFRIGGRALSFPVIQTVSKMSLITMEVPIAVRNAYSQGGIAMNVEAIANVKISSDERIIPNAIERFLNRDPQEIRRVAKETLEGHLRGVIANLTPEQVNEDRLSFAEKLTGESEEDLNKLGLHLDTLKISHVSDEVGYLDATGRKAIANIVRAAELAESDAKRVAEQEESKQGARSSVTRATVDSRLVQLTNDLRKVKAELDSQIKSEEEITTAAAREARARAEQELQAVRAELEGLRLQVDKVLPAEADRMAREFRARGEAALIRERGRAVAEALDTVYDAWQQAGPSAMQIQLIENLEGLLTSAGRVAQKVKVKHLTAIDKGDGQSIISVAAAYPELLQSVFDAVEKTTGINIPAEVAGRPAELPDAKTVSNSEGAQS